MQHMTPCVVAQGTGVNQTSEGPKTPPRDISPVSIPPAPLPRWGYLAMPCFAALSSLAQCVFLPVPMGGSRSRIEARHLRRILEMGSSCAQHKEHDKASSPTAMGMCQMRRQM